MDVDWPKPRSALLCGSACAHVELHVRLIKLNGGPLEGNRFYKPQVCNFTYCGERDRVGEL